MSELKPLTTKEKKQLFKQTAATPLYIENLLRRLDTASLLQRPASGFSLHEQIWHLADLEVEGFAVRIKRILSEEQPELENFDGDKVAQQRRYHDLPIEQAFKLFSTTRLHNLWVLSSLNHADWIRGGVQAGLGEVRLVSVFRAMRAHDCAHIQEIETLLENKSTVGLTTTVAA